MRSFLGCISIVLLKRSNAEPIVCQQNIFGVPKDSPREPKPLPNEFINDGYCDCLGGEDEFNTSACAGVMFWSGTISSDEGMVRDEFTCSIEGINIPISRVNDGICDCCDGSDERIDGMASNICVENCKTILEERQRERDELQKMFTEGYQKRLANERHFIEFQQSSALRLSEIISDLEPIENDLEAKEVELDRTLEEEMLEKRIFWRSQLKNIALKLGFHVLSTDELEDITVAFCYLEASRVSLENVAKDLFDITYSWGDFSSNEYDESDYDEYEYDENIYEDVYDEDVYDEDVYDEDFDEYHDEEPCNDEVDENYAHMGESLHSDTFSVSEEKPEDMAHQELMPRLASRMEPFKILSTRLITKFESSDEHIESVQFLRSKLETIERSENVAIEAREILRDMYDKVGDWNEDLMIIATMTLFKSNVGAADLYKVLHASLPEFLSGIDEGQECPPQSIKRVSDKQYVTFPMKDLIEAIDERCKSRTLKLYSSNVGDIEVELPTHIDDGYLNYFDFVNRATNDPVVDLFMPLFDDILNKPRSSSLRDEIAELETKVRGLKSEKESLERSQTETPEMFSFHGGLCLELESGEYRYNICPGGKASQNKKNASSSSSGTSLGVNNYGIEKDEKTKSLTLKFTGGLKCWNGPNRSATVYITCGSSHAILTATEPETCVYEFTMQSTIACDDDFAKIHGLEIPS